MTNSRKPQRIDDYLVHRLFYPQVPIILCAKNGIDLAGMPANSYISVSDSPGMISIAISKDSRTDRIVYKSRLFSLNWMNFARKESIGLILKLSSRSKTKEGIAPDKLKMHHIPYFILRGTPVIKGSEAYTICKVVRRLTTGDHSLYIASVIDAYATSDFTADKYWRFKSYKPILYLGNNKRIPFCSF